MVPQTLGYAFAVDSPEGHRPDHGITWKDVIAPIVLDEDHRHCPFPLPDDEEFAHDAINDTANSARHLFSLIETLWTVQHRTHIHALYVFRSWFRMLYFDRMGGAVSGWYCWSSGDRATLQNFVGRLAQMDNAERGFDPTVTLAGRIETERMRDCATSKYPHSIRQRIHQAVGWDPEKQAFESSIWPVYRVKVETKLFLIGRPAFTATDMFLGRCTRGYVGYDLQRKAPCFIKDFWRLDREGHHQEHEIYAMLKAAGVRHILTCLGGGDVGGFRSQVTMSRGLSTTTKVPARIHARTALLEICIPLDNFSGFQELSLIMSDVMLGTPFLPWLS